MPVLEEERSWGPSLFASGHGVPTSRVNLHLKRLGQTENDTQACRYGGIGLMQIAQLQDRLVAQSMVVVVVVVVVVASTR